MAKNQLIEHIKSSWFKYFFEVFVVVFGILIAVGIDNWNDERNAKQVEVKNS